MLVKVEERLNPPPLATVVRLRLTGPSRLKWVVGLCHILALFTIPAPRALTVDRPAARGCSEVRKPLKRARP